MKQAHCVRCDHKWTPRSVKALKALAEGRVPKSIKKCPKCHNIEWWRVGRRKMGGNDDKKTMR